MFLREAAFAARLSHTNIVHVFDFAKEQDELYLAMEYIHGVNLQKLHNDSIRRFSETGDPAFRIHPMLAAHICRCVCRALHHAWNVLDENGQPLHLIHRDVSPQNILLSYEGDTKLTDFGVARPAELTTSVSIKGKLRYMSPEQALGRKLNAGTDIFSLGIVLYETALGLPRHLFHGDSRESILDAVISRPINPPVVVNSNFSPMLSQVIVKALERDPQERFQTAIEFAEALEESIQQEAKSAQDYDLASFVQRLYGEPVVHRPSAERSWKGKQSSKEVTNNMGLSLDDTENIEKIFQSHSEGSDSSNPQGAVIIEDSTSCDLAWSDLNAAIPTTMREHSDLLRSFLATRFAGVRAFGESVVRLEGAQFPHVTNTAFFAVFLGQSVTDSPGNQLGTCTFMAHAEPLAQQLRTLEPNTKKLVVVVANTAELGKGVREWSSRMWEVVTRQNG
jgi:serine/threonine protein kinase